MVGDSYEGIVYFFLRGTRSKECAFYIYIGRTNDVLMYGQFRFKVVCDCSVRPPAPEIATNGASLGLKH